jgi:hypothetical protein
MPTEMAASAPPELVLYTRAGCSLCAEAREYLQALLEDRAGRSQPIARLTERDIDADPALHDELFDRIPVLELNGRRLELAASAARIRRFLHDELDAERAAATDRLA